MKNVFKNETSKKYIFTAAVIGASLAPAILFGATQGEGETPEGLQDMADSFDKIYALIEGILTSGLGKIMAIGAGIMGLGAGVMMGKVAPAAIGVTIALLTLIGPKILSGIFTAVI